MFLSRISLTNVRSIESMELDFSTGSATNRRWTLLLGENGCGKSSLLRAIALLLAGSDALPDLLGEPDSWIKNGAKECRIAGKLVTLKGEPREIQLIINRGDRLKTIFDRNSDSLRALDAAIVKANRNYFVLGYGVSRRPSWGKTGSVVFEEKSRSPRARALATMFSPEPTLVSLEQWAMDLDYRKGQRSLNAVRYALDRLLPDMTFANIDRKNRQLVFQTIDGKVPLSQLSDGYQNMAAWCGDLLYRICESFQDRTDPLKARGVLLIDELDLHLHPVWRRRLVNFLSDTLPNFQFIATTHSALTAQQCGEGELYVIRRQGPHHTPALVPFIGEPRKMMLHQLLMSPMFGIESMDSVEVEQARAEVRKLRAKKTPLIAAEKTRMVEMQRVLRAAPDWDAVPHYAREQTSLLKDIKGAIAKDGKRPQISPTKLRSTIKSLVRKK